MGMKFALPLLLAIASAAPLAAQAEDGKILGLQLRADCPTDNVRDAVGGSSKLGFGASLQVEQDIEDGYKWRVALGMDQWGWGNWLGQDGFRGRVQATHVTLEGVKMLRPDVDEHLLGPYLFLGVTACGWTVDQKDADNGVTVTRRVVHPAGTFGLGYRVTPSWDIEARGLFGRVDPAFSGELFSLGVTFRF